MPDIALKKTADGFNFDLAISMVDLALDSGLETAVLISVFSDKRVTSDKLPLGETDMHGWWGDEFLENSGDQIGSELWTIAREKRTPQTLARAKQCIVESLQWLITDGVALSVDASTEWNPDGTLAALVSIKRPNAKDVSFRFSSNWNAELGIPG